MTTKSIDNNKYIATFIDDFSRCVAVYFMQQKSKVFKKLLMDDIKTKSMHSALTMVENVPPLSLRTT